MIATVSQFYYMMVGFFFLGQILPIDNLPTSY